MTLVRAGQARTDAVRRAVRFLVQRQQENGDWPMEPMAGVFNRSGAINYDNYRRYFPVRALANALEAGAGFPDESLDATA